MSGPTAVCNTRDQRLCYEPQPSPDEVKRSQTATAGALRRGKEVAKFVATEIAVDAGLHGLEHAASRSSSGIVRAGAKAAPYVAIGVAAVKGTILLNEILDISRQEGKELNQAYAAQARDVSILMIVATTDPGSMPAGYLPHRAAAIGADKFQHPAFKLASEITSSSQADAVELRTAVVGSFNQGRAAVYANQISNPQELNAALQDPQLKKQFESDPAFRQGVLAAMDQATRDPSGFDANVQLVLAQRYRSVHPS